MFRRSVPKNGSAQSTNPSANGIIIGEKNLKAAEIAEIVRESSVTVLRWLNRYIAEGIEGSMDASRTGRSSILTDAFHQRLLEVVRRRPKSDS